MGILSRIRDYVGGNEVDEQDRLRQREQLAAVERKAYDEEKAKRAREKADEKLAKEARAKRAAIEHGKQRARPVSEQAASMAGEAIRAVQQVPKSSVGHIASNTVKGVARAAVQIPREVTGEVRRAKRAPARSASRKAAPKRAPQQTVRVVVEQAGTRRVSKPSKSSKPVTLKKAKPVVVSKRAAFPTSKKNRRLNVR